MKRVFCLFLLIFVCVLFLFSCGSTETPPSEEPTKPSDPVLTFESNGDGTCTLTALTLYEDVALEIPAHSPAGDTVTGIASGVLKDSDTCAITALYIPASVRKIAIDVLVGCHRLERITVAEGNAVLVSRDGHLYTKDLSILLKYASASEATDYLAPKELAYIATGAFSSCYNLTSVSLSTSLRYVLPNAFSACERLTDVHYHGTASGWGGVLVGRGNDDLLDAELHTVTLENNTEGEVILCLDPSAAPITVENFLSLVTAGFYDGLTLHRIIPGFMIQGGDPNGNGTGGSDHTIKGEFGSNGVSNPLKHTRGVLSMARSSAYDSASSQFFICHADAPWLDGAYAAFGWVAEGMQTVDAIAEVPYSFTDSNGSVPRTEQPVIVRATVLTDYEGAEEGYAYVKLVFSYYSPVPSA